MHADDKTFINKCKGHFSKYIDHMEAIKIKDALRTCMEFSSECNGYMQETKPFDTCKSDLPRCNQIMAVCAGTLYVLCAMLEPFMPSFSAKVYDQMAIKREAKHENFLELLQKDFEGTMLSVVPAGHVIGNPEPIFRKIEPEEGDNWKKRFGGD